MLNIEWLSLHWDTPISNVQVMYHGVQTQLHPAALGPRLHCHRGFEIKVFSAEGIHDY